MAHPGLRAVIRRSQMTAAAQRAAGERPPVLVGDLRIDPDSRSATFSGNPLTLTPVEYDLLHSLASAAGRVKTREQLLLDAADRDLEAFDRSIDVHISSLRKKLGDDARSPRFIVTVRSAGYMMAKPGAELP